VPFLNPKHCARYLTGNEIEKRPNTYAYNAAHRAQTILQKQFLFWIAHCDKHHIDLRVANSVDDLKNSLASKWPCRQPTN
jgi:hypothetical protein